MVYKATELYQTPQVFPNILVNNFAKCGNMEELKQNIMTRDMRKWNINSCTDGEQAPKQAVIIKKDNKRNRTDGGDKAFVFCSTIKYPRRIFRWD